MVRLEAGNLKAIEFLTILSWEREQERACLYTFWFYYVSTNICSMCTDVTAKNALTA